MAAVTVAVVAVADALEGMRAASGGAARAAATSIEMIVSISTKRVVAVVVAEGGVAAGARLRYQRGRLVREIANRTRASREKSHRRFIIGYACFSKGGVDRPVEGTFPKCYINLNSDLKTMETLISKTQQPYKSEPNHPFVLGVTDRSIFFKLLLFEYFDVTEFTTFVRLKTVVYVNGCAKYGRARRKLSK